MTGDLAAQVARQLSQTPTVNRMVGVFRSHENNLAAVDVDGERIRIPMSGAVPLPGLPVWVESQNGRYVCAGVSRQISPMGTVASVTSSRVRVTPDGGELLDLPYSSGLTLTSGDRVAIDTASYFVTAKMSAEPPPVIDPGERAPVDTVFKGLLVQAVDSGSTNGGNWWGTDVYTNSNSSGAWFYEGMLQEALKGVKSFTSVEVYLPLRSDVSLQPVEMYAHGAWSKPGSGFAPFTEGFTPGARSGWVSVPLQWGAIFRDGPAGIGFPVRPNTGGRWVGKASDAMSGAIRFSGRR